MQPYEILWRTDEHGTPCSVAIEEQIIISNDLHMVLEEIPDSFQRVVIKIDDATRLYESMNRNQLTANRFYVDYNSGVVYFDSSLLGKKATINYYGRGYKRINASRITGLNQSSQNEKTRLTREDAKALEQRVFMLEKQIEFLVTELEKLTK